MSRNTISKTASTWFTISLILLNVTLPQIKADDSESNARLLVSKQILNRYLVEKSDILVRYTIYNVGNIAAQTVTMHDDDFQRQAFDIVGGQPALSIDRIPPQSNYSHVLVVRPKSSGYFNFTAAEVSYKPHEEAEMVRFYLCLFYLKLILNCKSFYVIHFIVINEYQC